MLFRSGALELAGDLAGSGLPSLAGVSLDLRGGDVAAEARDGAGRHDVVLLSFALNEALADLPTRGGPEAAG